MKDKLLYICYSKPQKDYLIKNGLTPEVNGKHCKTDCPFWVFIRSEELNTLLQKWSDYIQF